MKSELFKKLNITKDAEPLIDDYLEQIVKFIKNHKLDKELYNDIEERLFEKLCEEKQITKVKALKAIYEIGEPADIFGVEAEEKILDKIDTEKIFQESKNIAHGIGRVINYIWEFFREIFYWGKDLLFGIFTTIFGLLKKLLNNLLSSENFIIKGAIKIIAWSYSFIGIIIFLIGIFGIGLIPVEFLDIGVENQIYTKSLDIWLKIGLAFLALGTTFLGIVIYKRALSKVYSLVIVGLLFTFSFSFSAVGVFNTMRNYSFLASRNETFALEVPKETKKITLDDISLYGSEYFFGNGDPNIRINFNTSKDEKFYIDVKTNIFAKDRQNADVIFENMNKLDYSFENEKLKIFRENDITFKNPLPIQVVTREINISVPKNLEVKMNLNYGNYYIYGVDFHQDEENYYGNYNYLCAFDGLIKYNKEKELFDCQRQI